MTGVPVRVAPPQAASLALAAVAALCALVLLAPASRAETGARVRPMPYAVDISRASAAELCLLEGVGPALAARIVAYRAVHGPFASMEAVLEVEGVGPSTLEALRRGARAGGP